MFKQMQKLGKAFMLPIAILPAAGLLLGIGGALSNPNAVSTYPFLNVSFLQGLFTIMSMAGEVVFANLALIMTIGLAVGLAKKDKGTAALAAAVGFLVMNASIKAMLIVFSSLTTSIDTGVVGSITIGVVTTLLHNRYRNVAMPSFLGFFGGSRFVPIVTAFSAIFIGAFFFLVWPPFQKLLVSGSIAISHLGVFGTFLYGFLLRLTGAVGLHHTIYPLFWYTELGGIATVSGEQIAGAQKIFFAQLADPFHEGLYTHGTRYFAGRFATMMFGLPAACLAMYHCVSPQRRKLVVGLFASAALTSFLTGITEPIEFMFLFVAPYLYVIHAFFDGLSFMIADLLSIRIGNTFSGGVIDFTLFGILQGQAKTHFLYVFPLGAVWAVLYYITFRFMITHFNIATPGREGNEDDAINVETKGTLTSTAMEVLEALGGKENIEDCDACITRLRVSVKDRNLVDKAKIKTLGATAVLEVDGGVQAVFGAKADLIKSIINEHLNLDDE